MSMPSNYRNNCTGTTDEVEMSMPKVDTSIYDELQP
jgi:hypothetical protein